MLSIIFCCIVETILEVMFGPEDDSQNPTDLGLVQRCVSYLFEDLRTKSTDDRGTIKNYNIQAQFIQLYREQLHDLLDPSGNEIALKIRFDPHANSPYVPGLKQMPVTSLGDLLQLLGVAQKNRVVDATLMNAVSSRSHMLMTLVVTQEMTSGSLKKSKLNFIDLAGSESFTKALGTGANIDNKKMQELKTINLSLTQLTTCINDLSKGRTPSYRSSSLTFMLMDSLGGNSKTSLLVACSPHIFNRFETVRTLRFAKTAKNVKNKAKVNSELSKEQLKALIKKLQRENKKLKSQLELALGQLQKHGIEMPRSTLKKRKTLLGGSLIVPTTAATPVSNELTLGPNSSMTIQVTGTQQITATATATAFTAENQDKIDDFDIENDDAGEIDIDINADVDADIGADEEKKGQDNSNKSKSASKNAKAIAKPKVDETQQTKANPKNGNTSEMVLTQTTDMWINSSTSTSTSAGHVKSRSVNLTIEDEVTKHQQTSLRKVPSLQRQGTLSIANFDDFTTLMDGLDKEEVDNFVQELKDLQDGMSKQEQEAN
ncbi:hypothetical protein RFI_05443, partial [Reticulomyxa filosa]